jgi:hypothetical protein
LLCKRTAPNYCLLDIDAVAPSNTWPGLWHARARDLAGNALEHTTWEFKRADRTSYLFTLQRMDNEIWQERALFLPMNKNTRCFGMSFVYLVLLMVALLSSLHIRKSQSNQRVDWYFSVWIFLFHGRASKNMSYWTNTNSHTDIYTNNFTNQPLLAEHKIRFY